MPRRLARVVVLLALAPMLATGSGCALAPANLPSAEEHPRGEPLAIDGLWRSDGIALVFRMDAGRAIAAQPYVAGILQVQEGQVAMRDLKQTGPRTFEAWDIAWSAAWKGTLRDDGTMAVQMGSIYTDVSRPLHLEHPAWFERQLAASTILPVPNTARQGGGALAGATMQGAGAPAGGAVAAVQGALPAHFDTSSFGSYHALVIGNDLYQHLTQLRTARNDARAVAQLLEQAYGMSTTLLLDATRQQILLAFSDLRSKLGPQDNLLIYYAGHGWLDEDANEGYWLPVDADRGNDVHWIPNSTINSHFRALPAKHVLVVADSCYSGTLTRGIRIEVDSAPSDLQRLASSKARIVLTSGGDEPVEDGAGNHSAFAIAFLEALRRNTGVLDTTTLYAQIRRPVMLAADQQPELADIRKAGHEGGDFLFVRRAGAR